MTKIKIPPLSSRLNHGFLTKNEWLVKYYQFRKYHKTPESLKKDASLFLNSIGKNSSKLATSE